MINFKRRTLRSTNNFINLSFLAINIIFTYIFIFIPSYRAICSSVLSMSVTFFGWLPMYYFYKQFSSKGKYITILPVSMKKIYLITFIDWFIIYIISNIVTAVMFNKIDLGYELFLYSINIIPIFNASIIPALSEALSFLRVNFLIISGVTIAKFYKINWIVVSGGFIVFDKVIDVLLRYCFIEKHDFNIGFFNMFVDVEYSIMSILISVIAGIVFIFSTTKLDKISIE